MKRHWLQFYTELKRLLPYSTAFFVSLLITVLLALFMTLLAEGFLPDSLQIQPFKVGLYVEGEDLVSEYIKSYVTGMKSTEGIWKFEIMENHLESGQMEEENLAAVITIPERTVDAILSGETVPIQVTFPKHVNNTQWYLQTRLIQGLTKCGATYLDVPQTETVLLYEKMADSGLKIKQQMEQMLDLFHFRLVMERENWFLEKKMPKLGAYGFVEYYMAAGMVLILLFWGMGIGTYICLTSTKEKLLLKRNGFSIAGQYSYSRLVYFMPYLLFVVLVLGLMGNRLGGFMGITGVGSGISFGRNSVGLLLLMSVTACLQSALIFQLFGKASSGLFALLLWNMAGFICAGGLLPDAFLPEKVTKVASIMPQGILLRNMLAIVVQDKIQIRQGSKGLIGWIMVLFLAGLGLEYVRAWRMKKA